MFMAATVFEIALGVRPTPLVPVVGTKRFGTGRVNSISWVQFYAPGTSVITILYYSCIVLNFCQMDSVLGGYFLGFCFLESIFLVVLSVAKYLFW